MKSAAAKGSPAPKSGFKVNECPKCGHMQFTPFRCGNCRMDSRQVAA